MPLHSDAGYVILTRSTAESLPDPTTVNGRTHLLVNGHTATVTWTSTGATPFTENNANVASITVTRGQLKFIQSDGVHWVVSPVSSSGSFASAVNDGTVKPSMHGFSAWSYDPIPPMGTGSTLTSGRPYAIAVQFPGGTITNLLTMSGGGGTVTNFFMSLHDSSLNLIAQTANQATAFNGTNGVITCPLASPQTVAAGKYYVAYWFSGGTQSVMYRITSAGSQQFNANLATPNLRFAESSVTGLTTTAPASLGTLTTPSSLNWVAVS